MINHCKPIQSLLSWGPECQRLVLATPSYHWKQCYCTCTQRWRCEWSLQGPSRNRHNVWKSPLGKQQWEELLTDIVPRDTVRQSTLQHPPAGQRQPFTWRKVLWGANTGPCHVISPAKAREMHQLTEEVAPGRTAEGHKRRPYLALLSWVCDDGETQWVSYQLFWGLWTSWDSQTEQPHLKELWWDRNKPCE